MNRSSRYARARRLLMDHLVTGLENHARYIVIYGTILQVSEWIYWEGRCE